MEMRGLGLTPRLRSIAAPVQVPFKSRASCRKLSAYLFSKLQFLVHWQLFKKRNRLLCRSRFAMEMRGLEPLPPVGHVLCPPCGRLRMLSPPSVAAFPRWLGASYGKGLKSKFIVTRKYCLK